MTRKTDAELAYVAVTRRARAAEAAAWRKYRSIVLKLPVMVHTEGLAPALHFVAGRTDANQKWILEDIAVARGQQGSSELLAWSRGLEGQDLRNGTREVLRLLGWFKRVVQAHGREGDLASSEVAS